MAEINKRNLIDETAETYAANTTASNPAPLFSTGMPAKIARASMANTNLLSKDGDLFVGTGGTYIETIDGTEYTYAKIAKKNQSELFINGLNSTATNVGLAASVGKFIDNRLHISNSIAEGAGSIALGYDTKTTNDQAVAIGYMTEAAGRSIAMGASATAKGVGSIALGSGAIVTADASIQLGPGTNSATISFQVGSYQMLDLKTGKIPLERINQFDGTTSRSLCLGGTPGGQDCTVLGYNSSVGGFGGTAIGSSALANPYDFESKSGSGSCGVAIGSSTYGRGNASIAIGCEARVGDRIGVGNTICDQAIAIGYRAVVTHVTESVGAIQLGKGTNTAGGFQVWDYQLMDENGMIPVERMPTLQYQHNLTLSAKVNGAQTFYLSFNIITDSDTSFGANYSEQGALNFLETLAKTLYDGGYIIAGEFKCDCAGYDISNGAQMMWLSSDGSAIKYYYISGGAIQSRVLDIGSTRSVIYAKDDIIAGFKL